MPKTVIISKSGDPVEKQFRDIKDETLHKKCGFSNNSNFTQIYSFRCNENRYIHLFGKTKGNTNTINKLELPPPNDNKFFYGSILVIATPTITVEYNKVQNYSIEDWENDYEAMFGGFDDVGSEEESEDDLESYNDNSKTKSGYLKDDFVVDNDSECEMSDSELDEEDYEISDED